MVLHLAITVVVCGFCRGSTCPTEKDVSSGVVLESEFSFPGGMREALPMCFIKDGKLTSAATDKLVARDAGDNQRFDLSLNIVRSGVVRR